MVNTNTNSFEKDTSRDGKKEIIVSTEDAQKKLSTFGFSQILIENNGKKE